MRLPAPPQGKARGSIRRVNRYRCGKCPYIYDPRKGDPEGGIPRGTPFSRIPASWRCPVCGAEAGWTACPTCGLAVQSPLVR